MKSPEPYVRFALPSKGRLAEETLNLLANAGLHVHKPNPRQYRATIPGLPGVVVLFQRAGDIVHSVRNGSIDLGITGWDMISELGGNNGEILPLHTELGFGHCKLYLIVPEEMQTIQRMVDLRQHWRQKNRPLRVATKFPHLTSGFFRKHNINRFEIIRAEGTLEIAPTIGYADVIADLVSTGTTLQDNRLRPLEDGLILHSQASLIANRQALKTRSEVKEVAIQVLEYIIAHLRARENVGVVANIRGKSEQAIAERMFACEAIRGLQGPTISPIFTRQPGKWFAVHIIVHRDRLAQAIRELRSIGGSGLVVSPVTYIFEKQPEAVRQMLAGLEA